MRKINALCGIAILVLFFVHAALGACQLAGILPGGGRVLAVLARALVTIALVHAVFGVVLTARTLRAIKKSGVSYPKENRRFWTARISGFAVLVLVFFHLAVFTGSGEGASFRLTYFGRTELALSLLLAAAALIHVIANVKPILIALGVKDVPAFFWDLLIFASVVLCVSGGAFLLYYIRWNRL